MRGQPRDHLLSGLCPEVARHRDRKGWVCLGNLKKAGWLEGIEGPECVGLTSMKEATGELSRDIMGVHWCCVEKEA